MKRKKSRKLALSTVAVAAALCGFQWAGEAVLDTHFAGASEALLPGAGVQAAPVFGSRAYAAPVQGGIDAGSIQSDLDQQRDWVPRESDAEVKVDVQTVDPSQDNILVNVREVRLKVDDKAVTPEELAAVLKDESTGEKNFAQVQAMADKLTSYLHQQGYMTAMAFLPTQEIVDGVVTIQVMVGHYGKNTFDNTSELATSRAEGFAYPSREGKLIRRYSMDKLLLLMNDIPGVKAHGFLYPGSEQGTADVRYQLSTTEKQGGYIYSDNYGSRFSGRWRIGGSWHYNNLTHVGDQLSLSYLQSFNHLLHNYNLRYELPVGNYGTFAGIELYRTDYDLSEPYDRYGAYGVSDGARLFTRTALKRTRDNNLYFLAELEHNKLVDRYDAYNVESKKSTNVFRLGLEGDNRNARSASSYKVMHAVGRLSMDNDYAMEGDMYDTEGTWQKTVLDAYHIQRLQPRLDLHLRLKAQYPWSNLDSSEKIYIGGYNGVRAFPMGEAGGDKGLLGTVELRYQTGAPCWQLAAFWDGGWVQYNRNPLAYETDRSTALQGVGMGVIWRNPKSNSYARLDYAYPIGNRHSRSYGEDIGGTVWFRFVQQF